MEFNSCVTEQIATYTCINEQKVTEDSNAAVLADS